jgi:hypothetical protein
MWREEQEAGWRVLLHVRFGDAVALSVLGGAMAG